MAQVQLRIAVRKRWFFWPAFIILVALNRIGLVPDLGKSGSWLAEHKWRIA